MRKFGHNPGTGLLSFIKKQESKVYQDTNDLSQDGWGETVCLVFSLEKWNDPKAPDFELHLYAPIEKFLKRMSLRRSLLSVE